MRVIELVLKPVLNYYKTYRNALEIKPLKTVLGYDCKAGFRVIELVSKLVLNYYKTWKSGLEIKPFKTVLQNLLKSLERK